MLEVGGIGGREKRALVMIEPPGNVGRTGVLEVDDGVFVAVKVFLIEERACPVEQSGVDELPVAANTFPIEARKQRSRTRTIKTLVVIKNPNSQACSFPTRPPGPKVKTNRVNGLEVYVKGTDGMLLVVFRLLASSGRLEPGDTITS